MIKSVFKRFLKGLIGGAITSMAMVTITQPTVWSDFKPLLSSLGIACVYGAITGSLLAINKAYNWKD